MRLCMCVRLSDRDELACPLRPNPGDATDSNFLLMQLPEDDEHRITLLHRSIEHNSTLNVISTKPFSVEVSHMTRESTNK